jgi:ferredoxin
MVTSEEIKAFAKEHGADVVGIGSMDRFEGAPKEMDPRYIFPEAKVIIGMGFRINRGCFRGIEEGTYFNAYPSMGYSGINFRDAPITLRAVCNHLEDEGYESIPIQNMAIGTSYNLNFGGIDNKIRSRPVSPDKPAPDVAFHFRIAAYICGMGEIGYSKVFLTPQFGPRQRLAFVITDAPLEPDPIYNGPPICDRCMECVRQCSVGALSSKETVDVDVDGHHLQWAKLNELACSAGYCGANVHYNPFAPEDFDMQKALKTPYGATPTVPYNASSREIFHLPGAVEGARGCIRACFIHLEETGRISNQFKNPFRKRPQWKL